MNAVLGADIILGSIAAGVILLAVVALLIDRHRDPLGLDRGTVNPETHMEPLRRPGPAEKTLVTDLRQRRMLLRPHGLTEAGAAKLAAALARSTRARSAVPQWRGTAGKHRVTVAVDTRTPAQRISETPSPWPAADAAPLLAAPLAPLPPEVDGGLTDAERCPHKDTGAHCHHWFGGERCCACDEAGPQAAVEDPPADAFNRAPEPGEDERVLWPTGEFPQAIAEIGGTP